MLQSKAEIHFLTGKLHQDFWPLQHEACQCAEGKGRLRYTCRAMGGRRAVLPRKALTLLLVLRVQDMGANCRFIRDEK